MLGRSMVPGHIAAEAYYERGITVCDRWFSFSNFVEDMGPRPAGKTLDRVNNSGHYEPGNCRWATPTEQARNSRRNVRVAGEVQRVAAEAAGVHESTLSRRLARGYSHDDALDNTTVKRMKLNARQVGVIRERLAAGEAQRSLSAQFGVSRQTINSIKRGATWQH